MSASPTVVTAEHFAYLAQRTRGDDPFLTELRAAATEAGIPPIWIEPAQASFLQILVKAAGARRVVEVGTLAGSTAIALARSLPADGHLTTVELEPRHADFAESWIARSDVADKITVVRGRAQEVLPGLPDDAFDVMLLDADKSGYSVYLREGLRLLRSGGLFLADNAFAFGQLFHETPTDGEVGAVRAFNDELAAERRVHAVIVPLGDGVWVGTVD